MLRRLVVRSFTDTYSEVGQGHSNRAVNFVSSLIWVSCLLCIGDESLRSLYCRAYPVNLW